MARFQADNAFSGYILSSVDITQQTIDQLALQEAESSLRGAVEMAQLGTWSIDVVRGGLTYSDRLIDWFGYDPRAQDYSQVIPILSAEDRERVAAAVVPLVARVEPSDLCCSSVRVVLAGNSKNLPLTYCKLSLTPHLASLVYIC